MHEDVRLLADATVEKDEVTTPSHTQYYVNLLAQAYSLKVEGWVADHDNYAAVYYV